MSGRKGGKGAGKRSILELNLIYPRPWRTKGRGSLNEVLRQTISILYLVSYLANLNENRPIR